MKPKWVCTHAKVLAQHTTTLQHKRTHIIIMGARPMMELDERPTFTRPQVVWHHIMRLRAYGEERWAG